jgi:hypothetical protein
MRVKLVGFLAAVLATMIVTSTAWAGRPAPSSFKLSARGTVSQGVTVKPVLKQGREIGLVVFRAPGHAEVGTVPLGTFAAGRPSIHWNLKVDGKLLGSGSYVISIRVFAGGEPTSIPGPHPRKLTISGQHVHVS